MDEVGGSRDRAPFKRAAGLLTPESQILKAEGKQMGLLSPIPNSFVNPYLFDPCTKKIIPGNQR